MPRRQATVQRALASRLWLALGYLSFLPFELGELIAGHLVRECAAVTNQALSEDAKESGRIIELDRDVYASYVNICVVGHIRRFGNVIRLLEAE
jgi:hypothetical protein